MVTSKLHKTVEKNQLAVHVSLSTSSIKKIKATTRRLLSKMSCAVHYIYINYFISIFTAGYGIFYFGCNPNIIYLLVGFLIYICHSIQPSKTNEK